MVVDRSHRKKSVAVREMYSLPLRRGAPFFFFFFSSNRAAYISSLWLLYMRKSRTERSGRIHTLFDVMSAKSHFDPIVGEGTFKARQEGLFVRVGKQIACSDVGAFICQHIEESAMFAREHSMDSFSFYSTCDFCKQGNFWVLPTLGGAG